MDLGSGYQVDLDREDGWSTLRCDVWDHRSILRILLDYFFSVLPSLKMRLDLSFHRRDDLACVRWTVRALRRAVVEDLSKHTGTPTPRRAQVCPTPLPSDRGEKGTDSVSLDFFFGGGAGCRGFGDDGASLLSLRHLRPLGGLLDASEGGLYHRPGADGLWKDPSRWGEVKGGSGKGSRCPGPGVIESPGNGGPWMSPGWVDYVGSRGPGVRYGHRGPGREMGRGRMCGLDPEHGARRGVVPHHSSGIHPHPGRGGQRPEGSRGGGVKSPGLNRYRQAGRWWCHLS